MKRLWKGETYGNAWMYRTLIVWLRHIDIRVFYLFASWVAIPIAIIVSSGARETYRYFRKRRGYGKVKSLLSTYRNHCIFAKTVIDKFAMYAGHKFELNIVGEEYYRQLLSKPGSFVQLSAHIGCSEIVGYSYDLSEKPCNVLAYGMEKESVMVYRKEAFGKMNIKMIYVGGQTSYSSDIIDALDRGEIISVFADRLMNPNKCISSLLHGEPVKLAKGPFSMIAINELDVVMCSALKRKRNVYDVFFTPLTYDKNLTCHQRQQQLADAYTAEIERILQKYPLQWFNYYDLWKQ